MVCSQVWWEESTKKCKIDPTTNSQNNGSSMEIHHMDIKSCCLYKKIIHSSDHNQIDICIQIFLLNFLLLNLFYCCFGISIFFTFWASLCSLKYWNHQPNIVFLSKNDFFKYFKIYCSFNDIILKQIIFK